MSHFSVQSALSAITPRWFSSWVYFVAPPPPKPNVFSSSQKAESCCKSPQCYIPYCQTLSVWNVVFGPGRVLWDAADPGSDAGSPSSDSGVYCGTNTLQCSELPVQTESAKRISSCTANIYV